jgi:hypothetical protein
MATAQVGESRDGTRLDGERPVLEMISAEAPLAAVRVVLFQRIGLRLTQVAGRHLPDEWRRPTDSFSLTSTTQVLLYRREPARTGHASMRRCMPPR